jgi:hypothetical protein
MDTVQKLDAIAEYESQADSLRATMQSEIDKVMTPEIKAALDAIHAEFDAKLDAVSENIANLTTQVKEDVLNSGATIKGAHYMAVWSKGRVTWDGKKLDGMMSIIPALADARKEGDPSVALRKI